VKIDQAMMILQISELIGLCSGFDEASEF